VVESSQSGAPEAHDPGLPRPIWVPSPPDQARSGIRAIGPASWLTAAVGLILCVGAGDHLTGPDVSLLLFYLVPIGFGTWFVSVQAGLTLSVVAAAVSIGADLAWRAQHLPGDLGPGTQVWNGLMQLGTSVALVYGLGAFRSRLEGQELLARTDALTQIANRRAFIEAASLELERARRHGRPLTVAYVDCDDFKRVNDRLGHAEGDALLVTVAQTLRGATRVVDAVARLGGDEFGLILPETDALMANVLLARLRTTLLAAMGRHGGWDVGFSIGAAVFVRAPDDVDELMARADELMYVAKREAKGSLRLGVFAGGGRTAPAIAER
jgi:diguanylate cyclase (GGDEF)-like protein